MCTPTPASGIPPFHKHGAFDDIYAALDRIYLMAGALDGIGALMRPEHTSADEQLNMARRSQASAVFEFFGDVLSESRGIIAGATERLQYDLERKGEQL